MFLGWLLKCGGSEVPMKYIKLSSYKITPNQRLDIFAERDMVGELHRDTVDHKPVKIEFETPFIYNDELEKLNSIFRRAYTDEKGRTLEIEYYDPEENNYKHARCYMPDAQYVLYNVDATNRRIMYNPVRYAIIEY